MSNRPVPLETLRLPDVETFLSVARLGSINGAARGLRVTPSQVSKALVRLERQVGTRLVSRSAQGVRLSDGGNRLLPLLIDVLARVQALRTPGQTAEVTLLAASYLTAFFLPAMVAAVPGLDVHSIESAPGSLSAHAGTPLFDMVLTTGSERWPGSWAAVRVGTLKKGLYAAPALARRLGPQVTSAQLYDETFIGPIYNDRGHAVPGDDGCPLAARVRRFGHRTQAVSAALELACDIPQLVFAPEIAARGFVQRGLLAEIAVEGWRVSEPFLFVCHQQRVSARVQRAIVAALRSALRRRLE